MKLRVTTLLFSLSLLVATSCRQFYDYFDDVDPKKTKVKEFVAGLQAPLGLDLDGKNQLWVTEVGTGNNDGKVSVIRPNGVKHVVIEGFPSFIGDEGLAGLNHLLVKDGMLYILHVNGLLYKANIASYRPGQAPIQASSLPTENIGAFVWSYPFQVPIDESNPYNLTVGPGGNIYITDAGANAILRRTAAGALSVIATLPDLVNPTNVGPPFIDAVPTGIAYNSGKFYVTTLTGFPFLTGKARLYTLGQSGNIISYQDGFTTLTDIALDEHNVPVVIEHGQFGQGFVPNTGRIVATYGQRQAEILTGVNQPTDIVISGPKTLYVNSLVDGKIFKVMVK
ncbi:ScyD/ScyE family protein [Adhaeribacter rhizoryzae]|uniref:ScyD/ScyE family protein n=1 Tax=Adhaeribacter rhizoryzae TaxID=2607907 RepID=A0A5M6DSQ9_9BACT|nr:ScyD/ScyE family protein [Adhaeribacter rhizoryzae]KAA5549160.1 ScyD/ScyE family protein [Adhaeribacter rhizoryzae]